MDDLLGWALLRGWLTAVVEAPDWQVKGTVGWTFGGRSWVAGTLLSEGALVPAGDVLSTNDMLVEGQKPVNSQVEEFRLPLYQWRTSSTFESVRRGRQVS